jgi:hypothetical protein
MSPKQQRLTREEITAIVEAQGGFGGMLRAARSVSELRRRRTPAASWWQHRSSKSDLTIRLPTRSPCRGPSNCCKADACRPPPAARCWRRWRFGGEVDQAVPLQSAIGRNARDRWLNGLVAHRVDPSRISERGTVSPTPCPVLTLTVIRTWSEPE